MEMNGQETQHRKATDLDKNKRQEEQASSSIADPINTTVGFVDVLKQFFKAVLSK